MSNETMCEKCGYPMRALDPQKTIGMTCDKCGWGWVTTYIEPILADITSYSLTIRKDNNPNIKVLRILAHLCSCNYIKAKEQITTQDVVLSARATEIKEYAIMLHKNDIPFEISPDFPYEYM